MVVCYIFGKSSDIEEQSDEKSKKVNTLLLTDTFVPERHQPCTETFDKVLLEELKEVMVFGDFKYIVFKEQKYSQKTYHTPFGAISGVALGFGMVWEFYSECFVWIVVLWDCLLELHLLLCGESYFLKMTLLKRKIKMKQIQKSDRLKIEDSYKNSFLRKVEESF